MTSGPGRTAASFWVTWCIRGFCLYPCPEVRAIDTRQALLTRAAAKGLNVSGYHFAFQGLGKVHRDGAGFRFQATIP